MIKAVIRQSKSGIIQSFKVKNHGEPLVCAAVSALVINCINSIEALTNEEIICRHNEKGGYIKVSLPYASQTPISTEAEKAQLLLNSMVMGLKGIANEYPGNIAIKMEVL